MECARTIIGITEAISEPSHHGWCMDGTEPGPELAPGTAGCQLARATPTQSGDERGRGVKIKIVRKTLKNLTPATII